MKDIRKIIIVQDLDPLDGSAISTISILVARGLLDSGFNCSIVSPNALKNGIYKDVAVIKVDDVTDLVDEVKKADLVFCIFNFSSTYKPLGTTVASLCSQFNKPCIPWFRTCITNAKFNLYEGTSDFNQSLNLNALKMALDSDACPKVICTSNAVKDSLLKFGVPKEKLVVIYNGVDLNKPEFNQELNTSKEFDVIFVGRFSREKGVLLFLSGIKLAKEKIPGIKVCIVGTGPEENLVKSMIKVFDLESNVVLVPKLENGQLLQQIQKSRILVNSSFTESFGLAIVEAMILGVPVVAPNIEGPLEITKNGKLALLYKSCDTGDMAEKILGCLGNMESIKRVIEMAKKVALSDYSFSKQLTHIVGVINECKAATNSSLN